MRALALFSGGLDSLLAIQTIKNQGIDVIALHFDIGFEKEEKKERLKKLCDDIAVPLEIVDIKEQFFKEVLFSPRYGYGKHFNPCIDCHGNMFAQAAKLMKKYDAAFLISGEVVGQRPMSQRREALHQVEKVAALDGLILRPLSAKLLRETIPETKGWVDREKLHDISGRARKIQFQLAEDFGIKDFETPAGGCMLTEDSVSFKIRDFSRDGNLQVGEIPFVSTGRYFILPEGARFVLSRNQEENDKVRAIRSDRIRIVEYDFLLGPTGAITVGATKEDIKLALAILLTYSKHEEREYEFLFEGERYLLHPLKNRDEAQKYIIKF